LPLLPAAPLSLHNLHLKTSITPERYEELDGLLPTPGNKGKKPHTDFLYESRLYPYPKGIVIAEVMCSNHPFRPKKIEAASWVSLVNYNKSSSSVIMRYSTHVLEFLVGHKVETRNLERKFTRP